MTDNEMIEFLRKRGLNNGSSLGYHSGTMDLIADRLLDLLAENNRQQAEIESITEKFNCQQAVYSDLSQIIKEKNAEIERLEKKYNETGYKLECLLCHATGSKLSKSTYPLRTMEIAVNDYIQECCNEAQSEARKEFAERLKEKADYYENGQGWEGYIYYADDVDNLVKEMEGEG